jgi:hypothetical protein
MEPLYDSKDNLEYLPVWLQWLFKWLAVLVVGTMLALLLLGVVAQALQGSSPHVQGSSPYLQGSSPVLQGSSPVLQGSSPILQGQ